MNNFLIKVVCCIFNEKRKLKNEKNSSAWASISSPKFNSALKTFQSLLFLIDSGTNVRTFWREQRHTLTTKVYYVVFTPFKRRYISDVLRSDEMLFFSVCILIVSIYIFFFLLKLIFSSFICSCQRRMVGMNKFSSILMAFLPDFKRADWSDN